MITPALKTLIWLSVSAALVGFYLPRAKAEVRDAGVFKLLSSGMRRSLGSEGKFHSSARTPGSGWNPFTVTDVPTQVNGFQVPMLANKRQVKLVQALVALFTKNQDNIGLKSFAVYLLPGLAGLFGALLVSGRMSRPVALGIAVLCIVIVIVGTWKLLTVNPKKSLMVVQICSGLWLSLVAYAGLTFAGVVSTLPPATQDRIERLFGVLKRPV